RTRRRRRDAGPGAALAGVVRAGALDGHSTRRGGVGERARRPGAVAPATMRLTCRAQPASISSMSSTPSAQYRLTIRVKIDDAPGMLGLLTGAIGDACGFVRALALVAVDGSSSLRRIAVRGSGPDHWRRVIAPWRARPRR